VSDDFGFGLLTQDEKLENFERSTLKLILGQMGFSKPSIKKFEDLNENFTTEWFNQEFLAEDKLVITRIFKFNITDILLKPNKSEVIEAFNKELDAFVDANGKSTGHLTMVFKVDGVGRMVATTWPDFSTPALLVPSKYSEYYITTFPGFFGDWLGEDNELL
jgi:hypothetical protein